MHTYELCFVILKEFNVPNDPEKFSKYFNYSDGQNLSPT